MEQPPGTLKHREKSYTLNDLRIQIKKLTPVENLIIDARLNGEQFGTLTGNDLRWAADQIIVRTAALMGCSLPLTDFFSEMVASELGVFLQTMGYADLTLEEILLAIRLNSQATIKFPSGIEVDQIPFAGSSFNVDFVAKVLSGYMKIRNSLDRRFQNMLDGHE